MHYKHLSLALLTVASAFAASTDPMDYPASRNICGNGQYQSFCTELEHMYQAAKAAGIKTKEELRTIRHPYHSLDLRAETTGLVMNTIMNNLNTITQRPDLDPKIQLIMQNHDQDFIEAWEQFFPIFLSYAGSNETERILLLSSYILFSLIQAQQFIQELNN